MDKSVQMTLIIAGTILLVAFVAIGVFYSTVNRYSEQTLNVNGQSTIEVVPDLVSVYLNVQTRGTTSKIASDANSEAVKKLKASLVASGFKESEIQTENFNVYEDFEWIKDRQVSKGFVASHSIKVKFSTGDTEKIGDVVDAGVDANATISYINFELSQENQNKYKAQAMKLAAEDARVKAESVASGLNQEVGDLVSVSVNNFGYSPWNIYTNSRAAGVSYDSAEEMKTEVAAVDISPSSQDISATVNAVFELK